MSALDDGVVPGGYVRDIVERVTPSILFGRSAGLTRLDEFEARHVSETVAQLRVRSTAIAERHRAGTWRSPARPIAWPTAGWCCAIIWATSAKAEPAASRARSSADTPGHLGRLCVTWPYRESVLDLEPHGPLPQQIYWRRRALALGIAVLVIGVIAAVVVMIVMNTAGARDEERRQARPTPAAAPTPLPGENPAGQDAGRTACGERSRPDARRRPLRSHRRRCSRRATTARTPRWPSRASPASRSTSSATSRSSPWSSRTSGWWPASVTSAPRCSRPMSTGWTTRGCGRTSTARRRTRRWSRRSTPVSR